MALLSAKKRENVGMSDHEYATRFGWTFNLNLSAEEYLEICDRFESCHELEQLARKSLKRALWFRQSAVGRFWGWLTERSRSNVRR